jgi:hypothetical protein
MDPSNLSFDHMVVELLQFVGLSGVILFLVQVAFLIQSWVEGLRQIAEGGRMFHGVVVRVSRNVRRIPAYQRASAAMVTMLVPLAQLLVVYLCYVIGNYYSVLTVSHSGSDRVYQLVVAHRFHVLEFWTPWNALTLDWISGTYAACAVVAVIVSYRNAQIGRRQRVTSILLALPVLWFVPFELLGLVLFAVDRLLGSVDARTSAFAAALGIAAGISTAFYLASAAGLRASEVVVRAWRPRMHTPDRSQPQYRTYRRR